MSETVKYKVSIRKRLPMVKVDLRIEQETLDKMLVMAEDRHWTLAMTARELLRGALK